MKPFTIAAALDSGKFKSDDIVYTSPGRYTIGKYEITDDGKDHGWLEEDKDTSICDEYANMLDVLEGSTGEEEINKAEETTKEEHDNRVEALQRNLNTFKACLEIALCQEYPDYDNVQEYKATVEQLSLVLLVLRQQYLEPLVTETQTMLGVNRSLLSAMKKDLESLNAVEEPWRDEKHIDKVFRTVDQLLATKVQIRRLEHEIQKETNK
jgi:hypothetical protein